MVYAVMFALVWKLESLTNRPKPQWVAMRQAKEFCIWIVLSAQVLATHILGAPRLIAPDL